MAGTWQEEAKARGRVGSQRLVHVAEVAPPNQVRTALQLAPDAAAVVRRRIMYLDEHPVELTDSYYAADLARATPLAEPRKIRGGAVAALAKLGHLTGRVIENIESRPPTSEEQQALELDAGEWVLTLFRTSFNQDGRPMEAAVMTVPARHYHLSYELQGQ
ncbi:GntR family transcriptional regulator [Streptacidiphilus sp. EB129]|uniref:GntR family transcriptional regulator n=1 Tax=Streptacidiphilus sp. EB129 TaxID=3156262 RepID=UPI0035181D1C